MLYYLGKGTEFKKEECKEYKTIEGALRAAAKDEEFVVWDETGKIVGGLTDNVPEGALKPNPDGSVPAFDESGHPIGAVDAATVAAATGQQETQKATGESAETATDGQNGAEPEKSTPETENAGNGANTEPEKGGQDSGGSDGQQEAQKATGEGAETATDGQNGAEPEKSTPETENAGNGANTEPEKGGQDSGGSDGQQEAQKATGEGAETATDGQNGAEPEKSTPETENAGNGANTKPEESKTIIPQGTMRVTVICDGTLNLRRSADWGNGNICGRASRGQTYYVKAIHTVQGKKMVQTIDDVYLSGQSEHVQFEQL